MQNDINSQFLTRFTARGSSTCPVTVGPIKVKACKSIPFTEGIPDERLFYSYAKIYHSLKLK